MEVGNNFLSEGSCQTMKPFLAVAGLVSHGVHNSSQFTADDHGDDHARCVQCSRCMGTSRK